MPAPNSLDFTCNWKFGFNMNPNAKGSVGYLLFWSGCGGLTLARDIEVWNPYSSPGQSVVSGATVDCIGLIEHFAYAGDSDDPIRISAYVSKGAAANLRAKLATPLTTTKVKVAWYIISFDGEQKTWYEAALIKDAAGKVDSVLDSVKGVLQLFVSKEGTMLDEKLDLEVFRVEFQIVPADGKTANLEFATGPTTRVVCAWTSEADDD